MMKCTVGEYEEKLERLSYLDQNDHAYVELSKQLNEMEDYLFSQPETRGEIDYELKFSLDAYCDMGYPIDHWEVQMLLALFDKYDKEFADEARSWSWAEKEA